jgi:ATP-dependent Clp protease protease subunit
VIKIKRKTCDECDEGPQGPTNFKDRIWEAQLSNRREIILNGEIDSAVVERVIVQIQNINAYDNNMEKEFADKKMTGFERDPITVFITSRGGDVDLSFAVVSAIESSKTPITTVAIGMAMSGGFLILLAGHLRYAQRYASLMYHELSSGTGGKATEVVEYGEYLERLQRRITEFVVDSTNIDQDVLEDCHIRKTDWYMDSREALELGVIDGLWPPDIYEFDKSEGDDESCGACEDCSCDEGICDCFCNEEPAE